MMNKDEVGGNWKQFKGKVKEQWGKLTDDDMTVIEGKRDQLVGKVQERYGYAKDQAEKEVNDWEKRNFSDKADALFYRVQGCTLSRLPSAQPSSSPESYGHAGTRQDGGKIQLPHRPDTARGLQ